MNWARISPAAKAVLPVIACHCNERGEAFPGEEVIAALSGLTAKSVRDSGIKKGLDGFPGFSWEYYLTRRGKRGKRFMIEFPPKGEQGQAFFFYRGIIDGGIWCGLKPTAQAIYPVLRHFARYDIEEDESSEDPSEFLDDYKKRRWELCSSEIGQLAKHAGIDRRSVAEAMANLKKNFLLEPQVDGSGEKAWKVFLIPAKYWKASYLNQKLKNQAVT